MRSSEPLSDSSLTACFLLRMGFDFATGALASLSESLESNEGTFLAALLEEGLGLVRASRMDGCFTSVRNEDEKEITVTMQIRESFLFTIVHLCLIYMCLQELCSTIVTM